MNGSSNAIHESFKDWADALEYYMTGAAGLSPSLAHEALGSMPMPSVPQDNEDRKSPLYSLILTTHSLNQNIPAHPRQRVAQIRQICGEGFRVRDFYCAILVSYSCLKTLLSMISWKPKVLRCLRKNFLCPHRRHRQAY